MMINRLISGQSMWWSFDNVKRLIKMTKWRYLWEWSWKFIESRFL